MQLEQRRQAMLQLHLSGQQFNCLLNCVLYQRLDGMFNVTDAYLREKITKHNEWRISVSFVMYILSRLWPKNKKSVA